ncbi:MAG: VWA domain-containing protein [Gracilibacteraceae bacterium]|jgi:stress response protein SCP2|nr:VWA domain-containing protein [Gracilibacteraceae bacterium]
MDLRRGQKESLTKSDKGLEFDVECYHKAALNLRYACFGLGADGRLPDNRYLVYDRQTASPAEEIRVTQGTFAQLFRFHVDLAKLPPVIERLVFTVASEGPENMRHLEKGFIRFLRDRSEVMKYAYEGSEFTAERSLVICEVYRKGGDWRLAAVGRGYKDGFQALAASYGGAPAPAAGLAGAGFSAGTGLGAGAGTGAGTGTGAGGTPPAAAPPPLGGEKEISQMALPPGVVARMQNLIRQATGDRQYLAPLYRALFACVNSQPEAVRRPVRVVMVADASGSMYQMYENGRVQRAIDKLFPLATVLHDSASMDFWAFAAKSRQFDPVLMENVRSYSFDVSGGYERWMSMLNYQYNNEAEAMRDIMMIYASSREPVLTLFLTDGNLSGEWQIEEVLLKTSKFPVFWQFIGLRGSEFGILEQVAELPGRFSANANFLKLGDIDDINETELYSRLLAAVCHWNSEVDGKKLIRD